MDHILEAFGRSPRRIAVLVAAGICLGAMIAVAEYPGTLPAYLAFTLTAAVFAACVVLPPYSYSYSILAVFLLLGFWAKLVAYLSGAPSLVEPQGNFTGAGEQWDRALVTIAVALAGAIAARLIQLRFLMRWPAPSAPKPVPWWFAQHSKAVWSVTVAMLIAGNVANWQYRFYQVGVNAPLILPFHLNVIVNWWLTVAAALWLVTLLQWQARIRPRSRFLPWLMLAIAEAWVTTVIMLSRAFFLVRMLTYVLTLCRNGVRRSLRLSWGELLAFAVVAGLAFPASLAAVSWIRIVTYPRAALPGDPQLRGSPNARDPSSGDVSRPIDAFPPTAVVADPAAPPTSREIQAKLAEISTMVVGRWIGLEGVLATSTTPERGMNLLRTGLVEDPRVGTAAIYQRISKAPYVAQGEFTFMTLPGVVAVLDYSGSRVIVFFGMFLIVGVLMTTEEAFARLLRNDLLSAAASVSMANAVCQMNFPYLTAVFFVEMWASLLGLWIVYASARWKPTSNRWRLSSPWLQRIT